MRLRCDALANSTANSTLFSGWLPLFVYVSFLSIKPKRIANKPRPSQGILSHIHPIGPDKIRSWRREWTTRTQTMTVIDYNGYRIEAFCVTAVNTTKLTIPSADQLMRHSGVVSNYRCTLGQLPSDVTLISSYTGNWQ
jgi:hypothetical protein